MRLNLVQKSSEPKALGFLDKEGRKRSGSMSDMRMSLESLAKQVEEMKSRMEEMGGASAESVEDMMKEAAPELIEEACGVLKNPPKTWKRYLDRDDHEGIVRMEAEEFMDSIRNKSSVEDVVKESSHVVAAVLNYCMT